MAVYWLSLDSLSISRAFGTLNILTLSEKQGFFDVLRSFSAEVKFDGFIW